MAFKFFLVLVLAALATGQNKLMYNMEHKSPYVLGDIRLVEWQLQETKGAIVNNSTKCWPGGKIPYYMSTAFNASELVAIQEAMAHYTLNTCIRFVPRKPLDTKYIHIIKGERCHSNSNVGMVGGEQTVSLGEGCCNMGTILHVLGHTVGLLHEHTRSDRDEYVEIQWDNIPDDWQGEYIKRDERNERLCNKTYDCSSIMHYGPYAPDTDPRLPSMYVKSPNCILTEIYYKDRVVLMGNKLGGIGEDALSSTDTNCQCLCG